MNYITILLVATFIYTCAGTNIREKRDERSDVNAEAIELSLQLKDTISALKLRPMTNGAAIERLGKAKSQLDQLIYLLGVAQVQSEIEANTAKLRDTITSVRYELETVPREGSSEPVIPDKGPNFPEVKTMGPELTDPIVPPMVTKQPAPVADSDGSSAIKHGAYLSSSILALLACIYMVN